MASLSVRSSEKVSSLPMLFTGRWGSTDRGSTPRERRWRCSPCLPNSLRSRSPGIRLRSPIVATPIRLKALNVTAPTPQSLVIGSGARNSRVFSWATQTSPSGLPRSEAIFATNFVEAMPAETVRPTSSRTSRLISRAIFSAFPKRRRDPETSRKPSSIDRGSTRGVNRRKISKMISDTSWYRAILTGRKIPWGQSRMAVATGWAE